LTPAEITAIRERYHLSRAEFARLTRIGEASLARWEGGLIIQNGSIDQLLYLLTFSENLDRLRHRRADEPMPVRTEEAEQPSEEPESRPRLRALHVTPEILREKDSFELVPTGVGGA
jgi:transcriptional regulator with XRE-family HTH domain